MRAPLASDGSFSLLVYERYQRVKKSLYLALVETYRIGVAICKIKSIAEELSGDRIPRSTISAWCSDLDQELSDYSKQPKF
jgi:transposase-like protein